MDVLLYFTIVTIIASLETDNQVEAACNIVPPNSRYCKMALQVISGTACYSGSHSTLASISCDALYSFDSATTFTCIKDGNYYYWTPKATATCLLTALTPTSLFTLKILSSESTLFSSVKSSDDTETPPLTTHTMMPYTETMTSSSDVQIEPSTVNQATTSTRQSSVRSSTITASSLLVPGGTVLDVDNESPVYIWYIVGATVVFFLGILLVVAIVIIVQRRRRLATKQTPDRNNDNSEQVPEYTELDITQANANPYSALSNISNRFEGDKIDSMNSDATYLTPCASTNPDVSNEYINIEA